MRKTNDKKIKTTKSEQKIEISSKKSERKWWFKGLKCLMKSRYKRPTFVYLGEEFQNSAIILSNHEGTDGPMSLEIYCNKPIRMWGAHEMNSGLKKLYKYQTRIYYHEKNIGIYISQGFFV